MAFYVVWDAEITNRPGLEPYVAAVSDTIAKHGGRYLVRARAKLIEGGPEPNMMLPALTAGTARRNTRKFFRIGFKTRRDVCSPWKGKQREPTPLREAHEGGEDGEAPPIRTPPPGLPQGGGEG